ncbi:hypothetical protein K458DRAFT_304926 [Lentithecium fluviatile CBS 122367]|uniref:Uncharacterized protein n=1 Tax=Lentithecium fluviatile CBS 122367 TaxID=1168545 RepID=A0A6G1IZ11_9PLEO|nr:hypothetical protein K458DRAFT_304926 [Lentithecium fluviatile CBS 122367]
MGRYDTLNADTKDTVDAILPAIAKAFKADHVKDIIPEDIRMRAWDCERRDHIKHETEDDPRNWGVQFLKDLLAIARLNGGNLAAFQELLRAKVNKHEAKHPWCRLADIKEIKAKLQNPDQESEAERSPDGYVSAADTSYDSYLEELVEPEVPKGTKRGRKPRNVELYEARNQPKPRKRLRRADSSGWERPEKSNQSNKRHYSGDPRVSSNRMSVISGREGSPDSMSLGSISSPFAAEFPASGRGRRMSSSMIREIDNSDVPLEVQRLQAEIEAAEIELSLARAKVRYIEARERADGQAAGRAGTGLGMGTGTKGRPHTLED